MTNDEMAMFHTTKARFRLGDGETEAFVLAESRGWTVATDDGAARKKLLVHNPPIELSGTIGLLRTLVEAKALPGRDAAELLKLMRARGGRLPDEQL